MEKIILLVEDEPGLRKTLSDRIRGEGFRVEVAANGIDGLEKAATGAFDLVVLDIMLPKKNGIDVCRDLRQQGLHCDVWFEVSNNRQICLT
jgi:two-component system alkaline phosphatase synthesis response regulator PhoP